jgi:uncharacterized protein YkwD
MKGKSWQRQVRRLARGWLIPGFLLLHTGCDWIGNPDDPTGLRRDVVERLNTARSSARRCGERTFEGAPPVRWNDDLAAAALRHSRDLAGNGLGGHLGTDGSGPQERIADAGYEAAAAGEIVAVGSASIGAVVDGWLASAGHCALLMSPAFTEAGAAVAADRFWTVDFGAPR